MFLEFEIPSTILIVGPTQSGKTSFVRKIIECKEQLFKVPPVTVKYVYGAWQPGYTVMAKSGIEFHKGAPTGEELSKWSESGDHVLVVLDDVMQEACASPEIMSLFTIQCHHRNMSVIFLTQNIFPSGKWARTISLNCHYIVLFETKRDKLQVQTLGKQIFPGDSTYFMDAYRDATSEPYGYLLCDLHPGTNKEFQLRTLLFPEEFTWYYTPLINNQEVVEKSFYL